MSEQIPTRHVEVARRNVRLFIAFRVLFNARFYYPVLAVMFLDFGLTLEQFALLNVVWALTIVLLEVPLGAVADRWGRKPMIVSAAFLMVAEMSIFCFVPLGDPSILFAAFVLNRMLSGAAEACASGADEALAFDSLVDAGEKSEWPRVLERLMRWTSAAFMLAMIVGAAVYDPEFIGKVAGWIGWEGAADLQQSQTIRIPAILTLVSAVATCGVSLAMCEPAHHRHVAAGGTVRGTVALTLEAGRWILRTPFAFVLIFAGLVFDSIVRLFLTIESNYFRIIELPEASYGLIGAAFSFLGFFVATPAKKLATGRSALFNFGLIALLTWVGLAGAARVWPVTGVLFVFVMGIGFYLLNFFLSHYLNAVVDSAKRATVLSFKSLAMNLAYGTVGLLFAGLMRVLDESGNVPTGLAAGGSREDDFFVAALGWLPWYFLGTVAVLALVAAWRMRGARARDVSP